jgi:hypothetical protein
MSNHKANLHSIYEAAALLDLSEREIRTGSGDKPEVKQAEQFTAMSNLLSAYGIELFITDSLTATEFRIRLVRHDKLTSLFLSKEVDASLSKKEMAGLGYICKLVLQMADKYFTVGSITVGDAPTLFEFISSLIAQADGKTEWMASLPATARLYRLAKLIQSGFLPSALVANQAASGNLRLSPRMDHVASAHLLGSYPLVDFDLATKVIGSLTILKANNCETKMRTKAAEECVAQLMSILLSHQGLEHVNATSLGIVEALVTTFEQFV